MILSINPYLYFDGNGQEAVKFYESTFNATIIDVKTYGEMPENPRFSIPDDAKGRIVHAHLKIGHTDLMICDIFPGSHDQRLQIGNQVTIAITVNSVGKSEEIFDKLKAGGQVIMPLKETFFSPSYGQVTDKFGVTWHVFTNVTE